MELISVIVPVYKVEAYLDKCISSIVEQTYTNLEILLIDDGSPDNCPAICDAWAARDSRIKVIHKINGGVSSARNTGLALCTGEYVCFVDSDDWLAPDFVQLLLCAIKRHNAPIAICKMHMASESTTYSSSELDVVSEKLITNEEAMASLVMGGLVQGGACDKMYCRGILDGARFPEGRRHEDEFFTHTVVSRADRLAFVDAELYFYLQQEGSFMHTSSIAHLDMLDAMLERLTLLEGPYPALYGKAKAGICVQCVGNCRIALQLPMEDSEEYFARIKACRSKLKFTLTELTGYTAKELIYILLSGVGIKAFSRLLNFRNRRK